MNNKYYFIYKSTNLINNKIYIGKRTTTIVDDGYLGSGIALTNAIKKYGKENFKREILEFCSSENINEREKYWIKQLNSRNNEIGYNIAMGGDGGIVTIDGIPWNKGRKMTPEQVEANRQRNIGRRHSEETKKKMSVTRKGNTIISESQREIIKRRMTGRVVSEETKEKNRLASLGRKRSIESIQKTIDYLSGKKRLEETKEKIRNSLKGRKRDKSIFIKVIETRRLNQGGKLVSWNKGLVLEEVTCPHCNKVGRGGAMKRYHFDNCKSKLKTVIN